MQVNRSATKNKPWPAILAALGITLAVGCGLLVFGVNALVNPGVPLLSSPSVAQAAAPADNNITAVDSNPAQVQQLQDLVNQYQAREQQYQQREQQLNQQLQQAIQQRDQANAQAQQYQQVLLALQQAGIIRIASDGRIFLGQPGFGGGDDH